MVACDVVIELCAGGVAGSRTRITNWVGIMRKWVIVGLCAGVGALIGAVIGDFLDLTHVIRVIVAGLGGGLGGSVGTYFAAD